MNCIWFSVFRPDLQKVPALDGAPEDGSDSWAIRVRDPDGAVDEMFNPAANVKVRKANDALRAVPVDRPPSDAHA